MEEKISKDIANKDLNTKYFHTSTIIRRRSSSIGLLKKHNGDWISNHNDIDAYFPNHFQNVCAFTNTSLSLQQDN